MNQNSGIGILKLILLISLILTQRNINAQNIIYGKCSFDETGDPETMVSPYVGFTNSDSDTIEVFMNRIYNNLPLNWASCYCFINCHLPTEDTIRFKLAPGEKADVFMGFNTDAIPGIGFVGITIEQVGGTQKDTIHFSASTLAAGIKELNIARNLNCYPIPTSGKLFFDSKNGEEFEASLFNSKGELLENIRFDFLKEKTIKLTSYPDGLFYIKAVYKSGKTETIKVIKSSSIN